MDLYAITRDKTEGGNEDELSVGQLYLKFPCHSSYLSSREDGENSQQKGKEINHIWCPQR